MWSGDTCGQGWGINEQLDGLTTYRAMLETRPDFFIHCGDTIYADIEIPASQDEDTGEVWHNVVTEEVSKVAETLAEFRGRHRYPLLDRHVRALYAEVPTIAQWDDHETMNNWYPGERVDDDRYAVRRATCSRRAAAGPGRSTSRSRSARLVDRGGDGFASSRIYRRVPARARTSTCSASTCAPTAAPTAPSTGPGQPGILGPEQERWLVDEVSRSRATWKVISADLPLSIPSNWEDDRDGPSNGDHGAPTGREPEIARVLSAFKRNGVKQRRLDHRRRPLHGGPPLRARARGVRRLRPVLGVRRPDRWPPRRSPARTGSSTAPSAPRWCSPRATTPAAASRRGTATSSSGTSPSPGTALLTVTLYDGGRRAPSGPRDLEPEPVSRPSR